MKESVNVVYHSLRPHGLVACQAPKRQPVYDLLEKANKLKGQKVCWFAELLGSWVRGLVNKGTGGNTLGVIQVSSIDCGDGYTTA